MKVALLSVHAACNYGAVLQISCLQNELRRNGIISDVLDYKATAWENKGFSTHYHAGGMSIPRPFKLRQRDKIQAHFRRFREDNMQVAGNNLSINDVNKLIVDYDKVVVGSDQIWNSNVTFGVYDPIYFGEYDNFDGTLISYAGSWGGGEPSQQLLDEKKIAQPLLKFDHISFREQSSTKFFQERYQSDAKHVLDPAFFDYSFKVEQQSMHAVFIYDIQGTLHPYLTLMSELFPNHEVNYVGPNRSLYSYRRNRTQPLSVEDFVAHLSSSKYVLTNSYHGLVLSLKHQKNFSFFGLSGSAASRNLRSLDLLALSGNESRYVATITNESLSNSLERMMDTAPQYTQVSNYLHESRSYLLDSVG